MDEEYILHGPKLQDDYSKASIGQQLYTSLVNHGDLPVLVDGISEKKVSAKDLLHTSCVLAEALALQKYSRPAVVGILSENSLHYFKPLLAAFYVGCTVTVFNPNFTSDELLHLTKISKPSIIFCSKAALQTLGKIRNQINFLREVVVIDSDDDINGVISLSHYIKKAGAFSTHSSHRNSVDINVSQDVALILYSSGTSGLSKGVMLTHKNISACSAMWRDPSYYIGSKTAQDTVIGLLPYFHVYGFLILLFSIMSGHLLIVESKFDPKHFFRSIQKYKVSKLYVVPALANALVQCSHDYDSASVVYIQCTGAPLCTDIEKSLKQKFRNLKHLQQTYGMTEAMTVTGFTVNDSVSGSCGKLLPNFCGKIVDKNGKSLKPGCVGELCFKGDSIMKGYIGNPENTGLVLDVYGWLKTGDAGYYDQNGYIYIVDRIKELIKYKGHQIAPAELESVLMAHPFIVDAAVIGLPHKTNGELPCAFVVKVPECSLSEEDVKKFVAQKVSPGKWLRGGVKFVSEIPKSSGGKTLRRLLREQYIPLSKL